MSPRIMAGVAATVLLLGWTYKPGIDQQPTSPDIMDASTHQAVPYNSTGIGTSGSGNARPSRTSEASTTFSTPCKEDEIAVVVVDHDPSHGLTWRCSQP